MNADVFEEWFERVFLLTLPANSVIVMDNAPVVRLLPYHCHFNPIEFAWAQVKRFLRENNTRRTASSVQELFEGGIATVNADQWKKLVESVKKRRSEDMGGRGTSRHSSRNFKTSLGDESDSDDEENDNSDLDGELEAELDAHLHGDLDGDQDGDLGGDDKLVIQPLPDDGYDASILRL
ncbi:hypothetical protein FOCC_FOCC015492 [Frankliniella occidentalis]|nr:hypothetical protein FOCC_FOCC015492 [Frankliniella occidentalis]